MTRALEGKVAIVTGAGSGIGRAITMRFAAEGATVYAAGRTVATLQSTMADAAADGGEVRPAQCDVSRREEVASLVAQVVEQTARIDILINNAHDLRDLYRPFVETDEASFMRSFDSGFLGSYYFLQECYPFLKLRQGKVVNMGSAAGVAGMANLLSYAVTKEAIRTMTRVVAREWGVDGINVNMICPYATDTPTMREARGQMTPEVFDARHLERRPLQRHGGGDDIASVALFLVTAASSYITAHTLMVDGGMFMDAGR